MYKYIYGNHAYLNACAPARPCPPASAPIRSGTLQEFTSY